MLKGSKPTVKSKDSKAKESLKVEVLVGNEEEKKEDEEEEDIASWIK